MEERSPTSARPPPLCLGCDASSDSCFGDDRKDETQDQDAEIPREGKCVGVAAPKGDKYT